jgi:cytochrome c oxidase subunit 1
MMQGIAVLIFAGNLIVFVFSRRRGGERSVGCVDAGVVGAVAAAGVQLRVDPVVRSRRPLWDLKHPEDPDWKYER